MIVLGVLLYRYRGRVELLGAKLLDLLDLLLEALVLILREHILEFIVELLLPVLHINLKRIPIQSIGIRIS